MKRPNAIDRLSIAAAALLGTGVLAVLGVLLPTIVSSSTDEQVAFRPLAQRQNLQQSRSPAFYASVVARPLFNDGRRKDPPPPPPKPAPPPDVQNYRLLGLVLSPDMQLALVQRSSGDGDQLRIHAGDHLDSWTVTKIDRAGVQLSTQGVTAALTMPHYSKDAVTASINDAVGGSAKAGSGSKSSGRFLGLRIFQVPKAGGAASAGVQSEKASSGDN